MSGGIGADYVVECAGTETTVNQAIRIASRGGKICLAAFPHDPVTTDLALRLKAVRKNVVDPCIGHYRGRIVKTTGDGLLVEFASAVDAARCAIEVQSGMAEQNASVPQDKRIEFWIGVHVGDIIIDDNDIFGDGVNIATRLEGIADPG
jgi:class 3 adenylate cyclase